MGPQLIGRGNVGRPRLSGDGSTVVFNQWSEKERQWEVMRHRDGQLQNLTQDHHHDLEPAIDYDGDTVVWTRFTGEFYDDPDGSWDVLRWRDGEITTVGGGPWHETEPAVSGDGETVAWMKDDPKYRIGFDIQKWTDGEVATIADGSPVDRRPMLNHDGSRVFWERRHRGRQEIMMKEGEEPNKQLTDSAMPEIEPSTCGPGQHFVWSEQNFGDHDLFHYNTAGHSKKLVSGERWVQEQEADISADGETIVYMKRKKGQPSKMMLSENGTTIELPFENARFPDLSDDGRFLAWQTFEDGEAVLYKWDRTSPLFP